jgi:hypothetical protein
MEKYNVVKTIFKGIEPILSITILNTILSKIGIELTEEQKIGLISVGYGIFKSFVNFVKNINKK